MQAETSRLRERIDLLEEENRQLREALSPDLQFPLAWQLRGQKKRFLATLFVRGGVVSYQTLRIATAGLGSEVCESYVSVIASITRKRLTPFGIEICTAWGEGLYLTPESRRIIAAAIEPIATSKVA